MPTYFAMINVRYPDNGLECHGKFTDEAKARQLIEKELTDLYGNVWERSNSIQYVKKDDMAEIFVMALLDIRYSDEEQERDELDSLPKRIAALQVRLAELQAKYPHVPIAGQPFDWRSYLLHQAAHAESEGEPLYDTEIGVDEVASLNRLVDEGLLEVLDAPALCEGCDPEQFWIVTPAGLARLRDGVKQPPKPIKLRRKFDSKLRRAIRGWNNGTSDYEDTMDDLSVAVDDDEWKVIATVFDQLDAEFKKRGELSGKQAWELAEEVRAKLAKDGAL